jgi:hypothetical protein
MEQKDQDQTELLKALFPNFGACFMTAVHSMETEDMENLEEELDMVRILVTHHCITSIPGG